MASQTGSQSLAVNQSGTGHQIRCTHSEQTHEWGGRKGLKPHTRGWAHLYRYSLQVNMNGLLLVIIGKRSKEAKNGGRNFCCCSDVRNISFVRTEA